MMMACVRTSPSVPPRSGEGSVCRCAIRGAPKRSFGMPASGRRSQCAAIPRRCVAGYGTTKCRGGAFPKIHTLPGIQGVNELYAMMDDGGMRRPNTGALHLLGCAEPYQVRRPGVSESTAELPALHFCIISFDKCLAPARCKALTTTTGAS